jgi:hypothetical protein
MNNGSTSNVAASAQMPVMPTGIDAAIWPKQDELPPAVAPVNGSDEDGIHVSTVAGKHGKARAHRTMKGMQVLMRVNWALVVLATFGILLIWASFTESASGTLAVSLALAGVSIVLVSILYFFITPSRLVNSEVCDAMSLSNAELMNTLLEPLVGNAKGVYIPSSIVGTTQVLILTKDSEFSKAFLDKAASITGMSADNKSCIFITPPGYGLYSYAKSLGASFTREGLEDQIKDVLVNGLELVPSVEVSSSEDSVQVRVSGLSDSPQCKAMMQKGKRACEQVGCPICSFIACMVVEGTGMRAMISDVRLDTKAIVLDFKLL